MTARLKNSNIVRVTVTGFPGSGKTTVAKVIKEALAKCGADVVIAGEKNDAITQERVKTVLAGKSVYIEEIQCKREATLKI